ncbi:ABC transporter permease [Cellulomonas fengjieae]|uniref:ABC transporter permease n=1 Tax=Cellulomonas fengjieae TaxID=2819978 RepID=UPI001AAEA8C2|nr:ABC transporter permease [Cellulomonas fengjieae]MBO3102313.1 ABC transporter permease [Cellulomonas fengjieae]
MGALAALVRKDLLVVLRAPLFAVISVLVPAAFTLLYAVVIHVSTTAPLAVADDDRSPQSAALVAVLAGLHNDDGSYYEVRTTDGGTARAMYADGDVGALLTIPDGFGERVDAGDRPAVTLSLVNINADGTKNQHLRIEEALRTFGSAPGQLVIAETTVLDHDIPVSVYLGSALLVFAALYAGIVTVGTGIAREWEDRTVKPLLMAPDGRWVLLAATWASGAMSSVVAVALALAVIGGVLGYPVGSLGPGSVAVLAVVWAYGAALGSALGVALRKALPLVPVAVVLAVGHFLVSGYESYLRGFAHGGAVEPLWRATHSVPLATLFDAVRFEAAGLVPPPATTAVLGTLTLAAALVALAGWLLRRPQNLTQGQ